MKKIIYILGLIVFCPFFVKAQNSDYKKNEFFVGFSNNQVEENFPSIENGQIVLLEDRRSVNGVEFSAVRNFNRFFGVKGDVSATFSGSKKRTIPFLDAGQNFDSYLLKEKKQQYNFLGGVQFKDNAAETRIKPFAHALIGANLQVDKYEQTNCPPILVCSEGILYKSGFAGAFGGGLDIKINNKIDFRAIQFDYNPVNIGRRNLKNNYRLGIGIVF